MSSRMVDRLLSLMRDAKGTPAEPVRNGLINLARVCFDSTYRVVKWRFDGKALHPLSRLIAQQTGDPFARWDVDNLANFRAEFEKMLAYLPSRISCAVRDETVAIGRRRVRTRIYTPSNPSSDVCVVFLHGGGFVLGSYTSNDPECSLIAQETGCEVISVDYPLSPESGFPDALTDLHMALAGKEMCGGRRLVLFGESAGANLALSILQNYQDVRQKCVGLVMAYPFLDLTLSGRSTDMYAEGYFLTRKMLEWFKCCYLGSSDVESGDPRVSPLFGNLASLPPSFVIVGEFDPLWSDAVRFAEAAPGCELRIFAGMLHGFMQLRSLCGARHLALDDIVRFVVAVTSRGRL